MRFGLHGLVVADLELQSEIDRRIDEGGDRGIGDRQQRRRLVERQADAEMILLDAEVPKTVLQHDRHFVGEFGDQMRGDVDPGGLCLEGDIEMMLAGQARSEEHTSELQSLMRISYAVFCLKKKKNT